ncbi:MAG: ATP-binding protein [Chloroflexi bacterium]|nr:ATP-binding protein [Chloroflexota bacterium]
MNEQEKAILSSRVAGIFTPSAPIDHAALFAGRAAQIRAILNAISQRGQHVIIFGERGVGKTSLANILSDKLQQAGYQGVITNTVNCDGDDNFNSLWLKILREFSVARRLRPVGFVQGAPAIEVATLNQFVSSNVTPDDVRFMMERFVSRAVIIIDELDRITDRKTTRLIADTIKTLSDHSVNTTLVLLGVADSVDELIAEHSSIERSLVQIQMPRMSQAELFEIVDKGLAQVQMTIVEEARRHIAHLSQGLPHYMHLLALYAAQEAVQQDRSEITMADVQVAIHEAVRRTQHSILTAYHQAINGTWRTMYDEVLLACALAKADDLGYFAAADVRAPMKIIMGQEHTVKAFTRHLNDFCAARRGFVLQRNEATHRFRFKNPLMQPFVVIYGVAKGLIDESKLNEILK